MQVVLVLAPAVASVGDELLAFVVVVVAVAFLRLKTFHYIVRMICYNAPAAGARTIVGPLTLDDGGIIA